MSIFVIVLLKKFFWIVGLGTVALFAWLSGNGHLK